ncbi:MAG: hypothetical protein WBP56_15535 [Polyangia bacterium]
MKAKRSTLWLTLSLLVVTTGCAARTPLDDFQPANPTGGATSQGGGAGGSSAGYVPAGGSGETVGGGGTVPFGGTTDGGSSGPLGGTVSIGGSRGTVPYGGSSFLGSSGGNGVSFGGTGGTIPYCTPGVIVPVCIGTGTAPSGGSGGTIPLGSSTIAGARSGRGGSGGTVPFGGTTDGGGGEPTGGTVPHGGSIVIGGSSGSGGTVPYGGSSILGSSGGNGVSFGGTGGTIPYCTPGVLVPVCIGTGTAPSGGSGGTGGSAIGSSGGSCPGLDPLHEELIDNMNDGSRYIPQINGRAGAWSDSDDSTPGSSMFPDPAGPFTMTWTGDPCRQYAAYVYGGPFVDWGADFWFGLGSPYNASAYTGIDFWAKIDAGTTSVLRVAFPDKDTDPDGGLCQTNVTGPTQCYDHYGARITLTTTWTKYTVPFSSLSQDGWGRPGLAFDPSTLYEVLFQIPVDARFGVWIDDVAFTGYFGPVLY